MKQNEETARMLQGLAAGIDDVLNGEERPKRNGFVLLLFEFGQMEGARTNYVSNCDRKDIIAALKEVTARFEGQPEHMDRRKDH